MVRPVGRIAKMHAKPDQSKRDGGQMGRSGRAANLARIVGRRVDRNYRRAYPP